MRGLQKVVYTYLQSDQVDTHTKTKDFSNLLNHRYNSLHNYRHLYMLTLLRTGIVSRVLLYFL
jgi:hypothetical protein